MRLKKSFTDCAIAALALLLSASQPSCHAHESVTPGITRQKTGWVCPVCGQKGNTGNFCTNCGARKPVPWTCPKCGQRGNTGNFCTNCGTKRPEEWTCPKCGKKGNTGKFCTNCGAAKPSGEGQQAPKGTAAAAQQRPQESGKSISILLSDGTVASHRLSGAGEMTVSGTRLNVGTASYEMDKVQRIQYGSVAAGVKNDGHAPENKGCFYIYRHDGQFNAFLRSNVRSLCHKNGDTLVVTTTDSLYRIPVAAIDSIGLHPFATEYASNVIRLSPYEPYVEAVSVKDGSIRFKQSLPAEMKPRKGDILLSETFNTTFPDGFAGRVVTTDGYACRTEAVGIDDIFDRVVMHSEFSPSGQGQEQAAGLKKLKKSAAPTKSSAPETGLSIDLAAMKLSVTHGGASASFDLDLDPGFDVSLVKVNRLTPAVLVVTTKLDAAVTTALSVSKTAFERRFKGPNLTPMLTTPIPDCPIISVGIDVVPFLEVTLKGTLSAESRLNGSASVTVTWSEGDFDWSRRFSGGIKLTGAKAEAEGKVYAGLSVMPNIQLTGGVPKIGPALELGPSIAVTLPLDSSEQVICVYDLLKNSTFTLNLEGQVSVGLSALGKTIGADGLSFPFSLYKKEWYFVPLYTRPNCGPLKPEKVGVSSTASRKLLLPVEVGLRIKKDDAVMKEWIAPGLYSGPDPRELTQTFSGFEYETTYTALPTVGVFGHHLEASPRTPFIITPGVRTEEATGITTTSATIGGSFEDIHNDFDNFGLRYALAGGAWKEIRCVTQNAEAQFFADLTGLTANTCYEFQAYVVCAGKPYYGEKKSFITSDVPQEFKNVGGYRFEWKDNKGATGYIERKNNVYFNYIKEPGYPGVLHRYNDKEQRYAYKSDSYSQWWVDDNEYGDNEDTDRRSHEVYRSYREGRKEERATAKGLWNVFSDDLGGLAYYEETFRRHYGQTFGAKEEDSFIKKDFVGTGKVCGIECNIYDNHKRWPQQAKVWVDPKTGLCLRYELDGGETWFEVTKFQVNGYNLSDLKK